MRVVLLLVLWERQIKLDVEFCAIGHTLLLGRETRCFFELRCRNLSFERLFLYCHSILVNEFAPNFLVYPKGNIYYNDKSSPAFVSFVTNTTIVPGKNGRSVVIKTEGEKVVTHSSKVNRELTYEQSKLAIAKIMDGRIIYGYDTAVGTGEDRWTIKLDNSDEEEKEPVTKMEVEQMMKVYRDNNDNKSQNNGNVMDEGNLNDELSNYYKPKSGDTKTRKQPEFLLSPRKIDNKTEDTTPPNPEDATTCTMFFS